MAPKYLGLALRDRRKQSTVPIQYDTRGQRLDHLEGLWGVGVVVVQPYEDLGRPVVNLSHLPDLLAPLRYVVLIYAYGIDPYPP